MAELSEKELRNLEQRLRVELSRKKALLQRKISDASVQKRLAESPSESAQKRATARGKLTSIESEIQDIRKTISKLELDVKKEQGRKESIEVKNNYDRLKGQYDLILDKTTPEAKAIAERVNVEVNKLNSAYQQSGVSTRVKAVGRDVKATKSSNAIATEDMPFGGKSVSGAEILSATPENEVVAEAAAGATVTGTGVTPAVSGKTPDADKKDEDKRSKEQRYADAIATATEKYNMPDIIFRNIGSLGDLLRKFVDGKLTDKQFQLEIQNDPWYRQNSGEIKARYVQLFNFEDLVKSGRATGTTDYEQQINRITRTIQARARELNGIDIPDDQAKLIAKDLYIYNLDNDPAVVTERLVQFIRPSAGMIGGIPTIGYSGQALQNYQTLQAVAKSNGLRIEDILPRDATGKTLTAEGTLEQLALGKIDINRVAQDARKLAALGQPDFVKDLLGQGYDLESIYYPYKNTMASILELDPNTISMSDPALRMGINKEGDMNLYDYERSLRQDNRWQYTQQARAEVSDVALRVLRDFGFQG